MTSTSFILSNDQARSKVVALVVKNSQLVWYMDYWLKQPRRKYNHVLHVPRENLVS